MSSDQQKLSLTGSVSLGTGVMIGAGIFAFVGQVSELAGPLMPLAFLAGAVVVGFSAYSYIRYSNTNPSSGGIAMLLRPDHGHEFRSRSPRTLGSGSQTIVFERG